ncbi:MAG TPA: hypothetical protein VGK24_05820 [Candidatus Angelobacter sp.]|jgi:hypothetical protein
MIDRKYQKADKPAIEAMFSRQGFEYELPDFDSNNFLARRVLVDAYDRPVMAIGARLTTEGYMLHDPDWETPGWRLAGFEMLHRSMRVELREKGVQDIHIWLPPAIERSFGRRLMRDFHWSRPLWPNLVRMV